MSAAEKLILPGFIGIGPARTGTTWLHEALAGVAWLPRGVKETRFWNERYGFGIDWYASHFRYADTTRPVGEVCPYFGSEPAIERIAQYIPNCKVIITFRDPVDRAYSFYRLMRRYVWTRASFEEAIATRSMIAAGNRYSFFLPKWLEKFGRERVLITLYDDLVADRQAYLDKVTDFISARRVSLDESSFRSGAENTAELAPKSRHLAQNARHVMFWLQDRRAYGLLNFLQRRGVWAYCYGRGEKFPPLTPEVDARLRAQFLPEVEALEKLIGRDLSAWKMPRADRKARSERRTQPAASNATASDPERAAR